MGEPADSEKAATAAYLQESASGPDAERCVGGPADSQEAAAAAYLQDSAGGPDAERCHTYVTLPERYISSGRMYLLLYSRGWN